jgi:cyclopropane-fatty-acyl-phospholipid synthase
MTDTQQRKQVTFSPDEELYQSYDTAEDARRAQYHYEQPIEFFYPILGGEWNVYSCNLWPEGVTSDTAAQEAHLDLLAHLMDLKPGQRILDVGCGWGGPLVYLCKTYGVSGVGITVSPRQKQAADARIARYGVDARIIETHWRDLQDAQGFDAIYSDEVIVHFHDLGEFFAKCHSLLRDGGRMVHKELHFTHKMYSRMTRAMDFVNQLFAATGNYRTLAEELALVNDAGFEVQQAYPIPLSHYSQTQARWMANMKTHRRALEAVVGAETYHRYRTYMNMIYLIHKGTTMSLDVVVSRKIANPA